MNRNVKTLITTILVFALVAGFLAIMPITANATPVNISNISDLQSELLKAIETPNKVVDIHVIEDISMNGGTLEIPANVWLFIDSGKKFSTLGNTVVTNNGYIVVDGTFSSTNDVKGNGKILATSNGKVSGSVTQLNVEQNVNLDNFFIVTFVDWDEIVLKTERVFSGSGATAPATPSRNYHNFDGWDADFSSVTSDMTVTAQYAIYTYTVTFFNYNGEILDEQTVDHGSAATAPAEPTRDGYTFSGWDTDFSNVDSNLQVIAQYEKNPIGNLCYACVGGDHEDCQGGRCTCGCDDDDSQ